MGWIQYRNPPNENAYILTGHKATDDAHPSMEALDPQPQHPIFLPTAPPYISTNADVQHHAKMPQYSTSALLVLSLCSWAPAALWADRGPSHARPECLAPATHRHKHTKCPTDNPGLVVKLVPCGPPLFTNQACACKSVCLT
jgi:hypothetical protein